MNTNLWNAQSPIKRIDLCFKIDVPFSSHRTTTNTLSASKMSKALSSKPNPNLSYPKTITSTPLSTPPSTPKNPSPTSPTSNPHQQLSKIIQPKTLLPDKPLITPNHPSPTVAWLIQGSTTVN
jgi:hypothetical protein